MRRNLRKILEEVYGLQELEWILPHPFLPPRFRRISEQRNMILCLDVCLTIQVRWEGARRNEYLPLTPGQAKRLFLDVRRRMKAYTRDMKTFSKFLEDYAEAPFGHPRFEEAAPIKEPLLVRSDEAEIAQWCQIPSAPLLKPTEIEIVDLRLGGESPMGDLESDG